MPPTEQRDAIAVHHTPTDEGAWDGPENEASLSNDEGAATYKKAFAWVDPKADPDTKAAYKLPHHDVDSNGKVGAANVKGCQAAVAVLNGSRGGATIPSGDRQGVYDHLAAHLIDSGIKKDDLPVLRSQGSRGETRQGYQPVAYHRDPDETVTCPGCGRGDDTDANYCDQCDHPLKATTSYQRQDDETVQCPECKLYNDNDAEFCDQCGIKLEGRPDVTVTDGNNDDNDAMMESGGTGNGFEMGMSSTFTASSGPRNAEVRRENLVRARPGGVELREENGTPTQLTGIFSEYGTWYPVESFWEGSFMERVLPGAFSETIANDRSRMRCLFDHGMDLNLGNKPLGPITELRDTPQGPYYEVDLLDTAYNRDFVVPALTGQLMNGQRVGSQLGASMRFDVVDEDWNYRTTRSVTNPEGLPERTVKRARVWEFGPVTFPANPGASASARSRSDEWIAHIRNDPRFFAEFSERVGGKVARRIRQGLPDLPQRDSREEAAHRRDVLRRRASAILVTSRI